MEDTAATPAVPCPARARALARCLVASVEIRQFEPRAHAISTLAITVPNDAVWVTCQVHDVGLETCRTELESPSESAGIEGNSLQCETHSQFSG